MKFGRVSPAISVRDIGASYAFHAGVLGFSRVFENGDPVCFMVLVKDDAEIHLSRNPGHQPSHINVAHMFVDDVLTFHALCRTAGVTVVKPLRDLDDGQRAFVFADPGANRFDIGERL